MRRLLVVALVLWAGQARAWNPHGHRVVAAVAHARLQPRVQQRVAALLASRPEYRQWAAGVPPAERDRAAFLRAANWADDIRELPAYSEAQKHKDWHYINVPFSIDGTRTRPARGPQRRDPDPGPAPATGGTGNVRRGEVFRAGLAAAPGGRRAHAPSLRGPLRSIVAPGGIAAAP
jgi:hypothetical protein